MLTKVAIIAGANTANQLSARELAPNVLIDRLVSFGLDGALAPQVDDQNKTSWVTLDADNVYESYRKRSASGDNEHDNEITALAETLAKGVNGMVDLVSNVINPICREVKDVIITREEEHLSDTLRLPRVLMAYGISFEDVPLLEDLLNSQQIGVIDTELELPAEILKAFKRFSAMTILERCAIIASGNTAIDAYSKKVIEDFSEVEYFELGTNYDRGGHALYINWMFCNYLLKNVPENIKMSLGEYQVAVLKSRNSYARQLKLEIERMERQAKAGILFVRTPNVNLVNNYAVYVFAEQYLKWTKAGGTPEALYGIIVSGKSNVRVGELTDFETYIKAYESYMSRRRAIYASGYSSLVMEICRSRMVELVCKYYPETSPAKALERLNAVVGKQWHDVKPENIDNWLRTVFVDAYHPNSNAMLFINELVENQKLRPDASMEEIAEISRANFIADYLVEYLLQCQ